LSIFLEHVLPAYFPRLQETTNEHELSPNVVEAARTALSCNPVAVHGCPALMENGLQTPEINTQSFGYPGNSGPAPKCLIDYQNVHHGCHGCK